MTQQSENRPGPASEPESASSPLGAVLLGLAATVAVVTILCGLYMLWRPAGAEDPDASPILLVIGAVLLGTSLAGLLAAAAFVLNHVSGLARTVRWAGLDLERIARGIEQVSNHLKKSGLNRLGSPPVDAPQRAEQRDLQMIGALKEISENVMLSPEQRERKQARAAMEAASVLVRAFEQHLANGAWHRARLVLEQIEERVPDLPDLTGLRARLADESVSAECRDVAAASQQVREWIDVGDWDRARNTVEDLLLKHPRCSEAQTLLDEVEQQHRQRLEKEKADLYDGIGKASSDRRWSTALSAAKELISRFPESNEAQAVRAQMQVIRDNAEIQYRHEVEEQIKHLIGRREYIDAVAAARDLISHYPGSPQAQALAPQMPRLEQLAAAQQAEEAPPAPLFGPTA